MDGGEGIFCLDSKPIEICRMARARRCRMGQSDYGKAPSYGYCALQGAYYYGHKLHAVCGVSGVIHSFDLTKACVHDINYLRDIKTDNSNCTVIGDRSYISADAQPDLFKTAHIRLEVPCRSDQKDWQPFFPPFVKARKRIETLFSQLCGQFMIMRNYAKDTGGLFTGLLGKSAHLQSCNISTTPNNIPIDRVKYALA